MVVTTRQSKQCVSVEHTFAKGKDSDKGKDGDKGHKSNGSLAGQSLEATGADMSWEEDRLLATEILAALVFFPARTQMM